MLIQCHSCNTKYRLNLERIPRRKTFVRCKNCGTPIFIDPTEEEEATPGVLPREEVAAGGSEPPPEPPPPDRTGEAGDGGAADGTALVECPSCASRYRVPAEALRRPRTKLRCSQCGHVFQPPPGGAAEQGAAPAAPAPGADAAGDAAAREAPQFFPRAAFPQASGGEREMPLPDDRRMETMFDDLQADPGAAGREARGGSGPEHLPPEEELGRIADSVFENEEGEPDPERAYEEATAFAEEGEAPGGGSHAAVPDDQKYRFFLNPKQFQEAGMAEDESRRDGPPDARSGAEDLPHPDDLEGLPPLEEPPGPPPEAPAAEAAQPPASLPEPSHAHEGPTPKREQVPGQRPRTSERRLQAMLIAAAVLVLAATGAWGYWLATSRGGPQPFVVRPGLSHELQLSEQLEGRYVANGPSGDRLFVVSGSVQHSFPAGQQVRWVRLRGVVYGDQDEAQPLATAYAYPGNTLSDEQLRTWEPEAIRAQYGYVNGKDDRNYNIPAGQPVPFQLVFPALQGPVERTVAEIVSYHHNGQAVFIAPP